MTWFGWLTKGQMEISFLDSLTFMVELMFFGFVLLVAAVIIGKLKK